MGLAYLTYIYYKFGPNVGKYTVRPMDPMGYGIGLMTAVDDETLPNAGRRSQQDRALKTGGFQSQMLNVWSISLHLSNAQNPYDIPLYWLINRDPCNGLL